MRIISKSIYKPRYKGWRTVRALVIILDGIIHLIVAPFGYDCNLYGDFCDKNLREDLERRKAAKSKRG